MSIVAFKKKSVIQYGSNRSGNKGYGNWEQIKKVALFENEFSVDGGELTPTLKLKRKIILEKYKDRFENIYCD